jgi:DNA gyrase/topoisomerase IV subunit A
MAGAVSARDRHYARVDIDDVMRRERFEILEAILAAIDRRSEVSDVVASSETADDALARLRELLGISQVGAMEILQHAVATPDSRRATGYPAAHR